MLAVGGASGPDVVPRRRQLVAQAEGVVVGGAQPPERQAHPVQRRLPVDEAEAFGQHHFEGQPEDAVEHPGRRPGRVVLQRNHRAIDGGRGAGRGELHGVQAEVEPPDRQGLAQVAARRQHRPPLGVDQHRQELRRHRRHARSALVDGQGVRVVGRQRGGEGLAHRVKLTKVALQHPRIGGPPEQPVEQSRLSLQGPQDQGQEQVVDVEPAGVEPFAPGAVQPVAEGLVEGPGETGADAAPDDVMVDRQGGAGRPPQEGFAHCLAVVELVVRLGLERQSPEMQDLDEQAVPGAQGDVVQMSEVRQAIADQRFLGGQEAPCPRRLVARPHGL